ncbi:hypothetical protein [Frankia sp. EAN1pec]|uniref:hypothetical protein n=1 Tax=Parafrankia sp. (strain EAN1pec) TaxID=298653 RepID=UPI0002EE4B80
MSIPGHAGWPAARRSAAQRDGPRLRGLDRLVRDALADIRLDLDQVAALTWDGRDEQDRSLVG